MRRALLLSSSPRRTLAALSAVFSAALLVVSSVALAASPSPSTSPSTPATRALQQLLSSSSSSSLPPSAQISVERVGGLPPACLPASAVPLSPIDRSGPVVVDVEGKECHARIVVDIRVFQPVMVVTKAAKTGVPLVEVTAVEFRETRAHEQGLAVLPEGAVARRALLPGRLLSNDDVALPGPASGTPVKVVLQSGGLRLVRAAVAMPCAGAVDVRHHCARLPNGRQVHGVFADGALQMKESP
jgi:hypothetical protein